MKTGFRPSNGTEGELFRRDTCWRCQIDHDDGWHTDPWEGYQSCQIVLSALAGEFSYPNPEGPPEWWTDNTYPNVGASWGCTKFVGPCECDQP